MYIFQSVKDQEDFNSRSKMEHLPLSGQSIGGRFDQKGIQKGSKSLSSLGQYGLINDCGTSIIKTK